MPKINLYEKDLTTPGGLNKSNNIVYVPGFAKTAKEKYRDPKSKNYITWPHLFNTTAEFLEVFSSDDVKDDKGNIITKSKFEYVKIYNDTSKSNYYEDKDLNHRYINCERSMQYALALLSVGLPVLYDCFTFTEDNKVTEKDLADKFIAPVITAQGYNITKIQERILLLKDKYNYDVKFITTGGYYLGDTATTNWNINKTMIETASYRGDCVALIDHIESIEKQNLDSLNIKKIENSNFGAMFTPWCNFQFPSYETFDSSKIPTSLNTINMPGSLAYLLAFGTSIANNNAVWLAIAGASRGYIPYLKQPLIYLTEADIDTYQEKVGISINPITKINPYGIIIWGNRTLNQNTNGLIASSFLNIRQLCNEIKKTLHTACKSIMFEQNSDLLWVKFKSMVTPLLDQMQTDDGIAGYQLTKKKSTQKATLTAIIRIIPIEAVEDFEITLELADEAINVVDNLQ